MAAPIPASAAPAPEAEEGVLGAKSKAPSVTPQKIRELIDGGIAPEDEAEAEEAGPEGKEMSAFYEVANGSPQTEELHLEATSKEAFFGRVETFTSLKWAGKPHELSPLICAKYGWTNVECDMLKCASCQAYLCASLQLAFDFNKYKERCLELKNALSTAHEKFCFWPDSPCPDRFFVLLVDEPLALLDDFQERFQGLCQLELQLPSLKTEDLKSMFLTEEKISHLLQLIEEEANYKTEDEKSPFKRASDHFQTHITACVLALCGWTSSPSSGSVHLPLITCCRCMRKAGLWGFHQIESALPESEPSPGFTNTPSTTPDGRSDKAPTVPTSPRRMMTRSRDLNVPFGSEQEKSPSPVISRMRSWDGSNPGERMDTEAASPTTRSRPVTRSMGQGDVCGLGAEVPSSPLRKAKRARLFSSSSTDSCARSFFDPVSQHRDWCPWVNLVKERPSFEATGDHTEEGKDNLGWQMVLKALLSTKQLERAADTDSEVNTSTQGIAGVLRVSQRNPARCSGFSANGKLLVPLEELSLGQHWGSLSMPNGSSPFSAGKKKRTGGKEIIICIGAKAVLEKPA
ncbi:nuclear-interacting partner of ALK isoform X2 [Sceloporus undulatus]|uniref:nuclear-interacting partner of ALK isoform X2 n=1 Tax=Sceloporus undulatus TaxID=8520 RepID=UPI001C4B6400|nr:nuclear-interacting partner of ALK isoform X2 [Sceloporus undulatus]